MVCEDADARVYVDGDEIVPINDGVMVHERKEGPLSINTMAEVWFASEWRGNTYDVNALDPSEENVYDSAHVDVRNPATDEYDTILNGYVQRAGAGSNGTIERRIVIGGPASLLDAIPVSNYYEHTGADDVLRDIVAQFVENQPIYDSVEIVYSDGSVGEYAVDQPSGINEAVFSLLESKLQIQELHGGKNFSTNRDTLRDVVEWLMEKTGASIYFQPDGEGALQLVYDENPMDFGGKAKHLGGDTEVYKNNALHEIAPVNTIEVKGATKTSIQAKVRNLDLKGSSQWPFVRAHHPHLKKLAGGTLMPKVQDVDATTKQEAKNVASKKLKSLIDTDAGGEIVTALAPYLRPYRSFESRPACAGAVAGDVPSVKYEVEELTHHVSDSDSLTTISVSMFVDMDEIVFEDVDMRDA